ncbi:MAG TPA: GNAT family N-acetyltransferase [Gaiellaceae bacterium]
MPEPAPGPTVDDALASRLEAAHGRYAALRAVAAAEDGTERAFGAAIATRVQSEPGFWYANRVFGLVPAEAGRLPEIQAFFAGDAPIRIEAPPGAVDEELSRLLIEAGFRPIELSAVMAGRPELVGRGGSRAVDVAELRAGDERFWPLYQKCFEEAALMPEREKLAARVWREHADRISCWVASVDGAPVAVAILYLDEDVAVLADAATLPAHRSRGCQAALIDARARAAATRGATVLTSDVEFGSTSHRNLQAAGLATAYTKLVWQRSGT